MHGELGYSLKELEGRLPASRSSLSRYLRGQGLPDERLLVQWCKLSFTGEDRLPALVDLLHRAQEAADSGPDLAREAAGTDEPADQGTEQGARGRRRLPLVLAALGTAAVLAGAAVAIPALTSPDRTSDGPSHDSVGAGGVQGSETSAKGTGSARITVNNVERACQRPRTENCALGLARDPYLVYRRSNVVAHVWHGDVLRAVCRIANGVSVTDEAGGHSSIWFRVDHDGARMWVPGIRIRPEQLDNTTLPTCPEGS
ncbi:helix-turn-helix domain-containing protein [Streptomyces sp. NRRL S-337]|uniref:helix-turn-helix domain-containing protein n=1 Tax=Streptomyces sp. NRRL S-337 TaxID=1463900 RepID=UPI000D1419D1|nr:helix-turn-helix transcriptional regulator [Streptomyces sp. NRRL S-337]